MIVNQVGRGSPLNWKATSLKRECLVVKVLRTTLITKYITSSQFQLYCRNLLTLSECLRLVLKFFFTYATATVELKSSEFPFNKVYLYTLSFFHFAPETFIFLSYTLNIPIFFPLFVAVLGYLPPFLPYCRTEQPQRNCISLLFTFALVSPACNLVWMVICMRTPLVWEHVPMLQKLGISFPESQLFLMEERVAAVAVVALFSYDSCWHMDPALLAAGVVYQKHGFFCKLAKYQ